MTEVFPNLRAKEYDEVPRGRVIGIEPNTYRIFLPPDMVSDKSIISKVMKVFALPLGKTEVMSDEHYVTVPHDPFISNEYEYEEDENYI